MRVITDEDALIGGDNVKRRWTWVLILLVPSGRVVTKGEAAGEEVTVSYLPVFTIHFTNVVGPANHHGGGTSPEHLEVITCAQASPFSA